MMERVLTVARKELVENLKSARYWGLVALLVLFYIASTYAVGFAMRGFRGPIQIASRARIVLQLFKSSLPSIPWLRYWG